MARLARVVLPGVPHHVVQRGVRSIDVFQDDKDRRYYLQLMKSSSEKYGMEILSYCLMSNHIHLVVTPQTESSLSQGIGMIHREYSRMVNFRENTRGFLFQGRFFSCPLDERHLIEALKYVELNPIRSGICEKASMYQWSSARYHIGLESTNPLVKNRDWFGTKEDWKQLLKSPPKDLDLLRKHFRTGRPLGSKEFLVEAERVTGRELIPKKPGRKRKIIK